MNLTSTLPHKFWNEDLDTPSTPGSYGTGGWTADGKAVLLYDHYDIWAVAPDGSSAKNITNGYGRANDIQFRYVRDRDRSARPLDQPRQTDCSCALKTRHADTGFFRGSLRAAIPADGDGQESFSAPVKAKDADVYLLTEQTFTEFPDLVTTDSSFKEMRKVCNANPQKAQLTWGTADLVPYNNSDGVTYRRRSISRITSTPRRSIR